MDARPNRIGRLGQIGLEPCGEGLRQRAIGLSRPRALARFVTLQFRPQRQSPAPAIGSFKACAHRPVKIGALGLQLLRGEHVRKKRADLGRGLKLWIETQEPRQKPVGMDAAMPVETAEKHRMQVARQGKIILARQHLVQLVRPFAPDMGKGDARKALGEIGREARHG